MTESRFSIRSVMLASLCEVPVRNRSTLPSNDWKCADLDSCREGSARPKRNEGRIEGQKVVPLSPPILSVFLAILDSGVGLLGGAAASSELEGFVSSRRLSLDALPVIQLRMLSTTELFGDVGSAALTDSEEALRLATMACKRSFTGVNSLGPARCLAV